MIQGEKWFGHSLKSIPRKDFIKTANVLSQSQKNEIKNLKFILNIQDFEYNAVFRREKLGFILKKSV